MTDADRCVFCGARAARDRDGRIRAWAKTLAMPPNCDHETINGET